MLEGGEKVEMYHELCAADSIWEAGVVFYVRSCGQLSSRCDSICQKAFIENGYMPISFYANCVWHVDLRFSSARER
jgi:hypothetical protein